MYFARIFRLSKKSNHEPNFLKKKCFALRVKKEVNWRQVGSVLSLDGIPSPHARNQFSGSPRTSCRSTWSTVLSGTPIIHSSLLRLDLSSQILSIHWWSCQVFRVFSAQQWFRRGKNAWDWSRLDDDAEFVYIPAVNNGASSSSWKPSKTSTTRLRSYSIVFEKLIGQWWPGAGNVWGIPDFLGLNAIKIERGCLVWGKQSKIARNIAHS